MTWGTIEIEPEVVEWLLSLNDHEFGQAERYIDLLADEGVLLDEPYTRQLHGKLRELRFRIAARQIRITYFIGTGRRIVLLTVFHKSQRRQRGEIDRARRAMQRCLDESHTTEDAR